MGFNFSILLHAPIVEVSYDTAKKTIQLKSDMMSICELWSSNECFVRLCPINFFYTTTATCKATCTKVHNMADIKLFRVVLSFHFLVIIENKKLGKLT